MSGKTKKEVFGELFDSEVERARRAQEENRKPVTALPKPEPRPLGPEALGLLTSLMEQLESEGKIELSDREQRAAKRHTEKFQTFMQERRRGRPKPELMQRHPWWTRHLRSLKPLWRSWQIALP